MYYLDYRVIHILSMELLESFNEIKQNYDSNVLVIVLYNIVFIYSRICQNFHLETLIKAEPVMKISLMEIFIHFLSQSYNNLRDTSFLKKGSVVTLKAARNLCIFTEKICDASLSVLKYHRRREALGDQVDPKTYDDSSIPLKMRQEIILQLKDWTDVIVEMTPINAGNSETTRLAKLFSELTKNIGLVVAKIMDVGISYQEDQQFLKWIFRMHNEGNFNVLSSKLLCNNDDALGIALSSSYSGRGDKSPFTFTNSIFNILLPTRDDNPRMFVNIPPNLQHLFPEEYISYIYQLPMQDLIQEVSEYCVYPIRTKQEQTRLGNHLGSLLFHSINFTDI